MLVHGKDFSSLMRALPEIERRLGLNRLIAAFDLIEAGVLK